MSVCTKCLVDKPIQEFYVRRGSPTGFHYQCKACIRLKNRMWVERVGYDTNKRRYLSPEEKEGRFPPKEKQLLLRLYYLNPKARVNKRRWETSEKGRLSRRRYDDRRRKMGIKRKITLRTRLASNLRSGIQGALRGERKHHRSLELLGCSISDLRLRLESLWKPGMTWENWGTWKHNGPMKWHIDHIKPCASFDLRDPEQQRKCFHYSNLQPLWAIDNLKKGKRLDMALQVSV